MESEPHENYSQEDEPLFDIRRFFGRQVIKIGNLIQVDFELDDPEDLIA